MALLLSSTAFAGGFGRAPCSRGAVADVIVRPLKKESSYRLFFTGEGSEILLETRRNVEQWGEGPAPRGAARRHYLGRQVLKYMDRRLGKLLKRAQTDPSLKGLNSMRRSVRPGVQANLLAGMALKMKLRPLRGRMAVQLKNPLMKVQWTTFFNGKSTVELNRSINSLGMEAHFHYFVHQNQWVAGIERPLTEHLSARATTNGEKEQRVFFSFRRSI